MVKMTTSTKPRIVLVKLPSITTSVTLGSTLKRGGLAPHLRAKAYKVKQLKGAPPDPPDLPPIEVEPAHRYTARITIEIPARHAKRDHTGQIYEEDEDNLPLDDVMLEIARCSYVKRVYNVRPVRSKPKLSGVPKQPLAKR